MQIESKIDCQLSLEGCKVVFSVFDSGFAETYRHEQTLYDFVAENLECYDADEWGELDASGIQELEEIISELEDSLQYAKELLAKGT